MTGYVIASIVAAALATYVLASFTASLIGRTRFPLPPSQRRIGCVDGLRGYVAISVLIHHFIFWMQVTRFSGNWEAPAVNIFNQLGAGGVALFFMTTGLLFYPRVLAGFKACSWLAIYTTRLFRIVPLVAVSVALCAIIIAMRTGAKLDSNFPIAAAEWVTTWDQPPLLGYPDSGRLDAYVLWSLWHEWMFYLIVLPSSAAAMDLIRGKFPSWVLPIALLMVSLVARILYLPGSMLRYLPLFAIGMIAYECQRRDWIARPLRTPRAACAATSALILGMVAVPTPYTFVMPLYGFFFICVACGNDLGGLLRTKGALILGECSYGIYLLHGILLSLIFVDYSAFVALFRSVHLPFILPFIATMLGFITAFTYVLIERPAMQLGRNLSMRWTRKRLSIDTPELDVAP